MNKNNMMTLKRILVFCLVAVITICGANLTVSADTPEIDNRTMIIIDNDGNIEYQTEQVSAVSSMDIYGNIEYNDLIITQGSTEEGNVAISPCSLTPVNQVTNTQIKPYNNVCYVEATFPDNHIEGSSGVLVHNNIVLSSAHALYKEEHGGYASKVTVWPGLYYDSNGVPHLPSNYESATKTSMRMPAGYVDNKLDEYDWALIDINRKYDSWQAFGYAPNYSALTGRTVSAIGYNTINQKRIMHQGTGTITDSYEKLLHTSIETLTGMSGGPIIDQNTGAVIGIVKGLGTNIIGIPLCNISVRIDEYLYNIINNHKAEMQ